MSDSLTSPGSGIRPVLEGDQVNGQPVAGFAWVPPAEGLRPTHIDDRLVLDGDAHEPSPPDRMVPLTAETVQPTGVMPPDDLCADRQRLASTVDATISLRANQLLDLPQTPWQQVIRPLLSAVYANGHKVWLAGGAARDLVSGVPLREIHDLDLSGTVPPGRFSDMLYQTLRATQLTEFPIRVNPDSLVCSVAQTEPLPKARLIEYRGLNRGGFQFPTVGSRFEADARHRDFRFNTLMYDVLDHRVFDPTGEGRTDMGALRFVPMDRPARACDQAALLVRALKFALRWAPRGPLDLAPLAKWITELPADLCTSLGKRDWSGLKDTYRRSVKGTKADQLAFAESLPSPGRELFRTLIGRTS